MSDSRNSLLIVDLHPEFHIGGSERVFRGMCRYASPSMQIAWFGASREFFDVLNIVYRCLGLQTAKLIEVDDTLENTSVYRFRFVSLIPWTPAWREARRVIRGSDAIYAKNELQGLFCIWYFGGVQALRKTTVVMHTAVAMPPETRGVWRFVHDRVYQNPLYRYLLRHARAIHGVSSSVYADLQYVRVKDDAVSYIGWPVWVPQSAVQSRPDVFTVVFAARLTDQKGVDFLLDVARRLAKDPIHFKVAGGGPLQDTIVAATRALLRFEYVGVVPSVSDLFAGACAALVPSRWEGVGTVCAEAFIAGIPPVAFDIPGNLDIFEAAQLPDLMVRQFDVAAMASRIRDLQREWSDDHDAYFKKYAAAGERVRKRYDADRVFYDTLADMQLAAQPSNAR